MGEYCAGSRRTLLVFQRVPLSPPVRTAECRSVTGGRGDAGIIGVELASVQRLCFGTLKDGAGLLMATTQQVLECCVVWLNLSRLFNQFFPWEIGKIWVELVNTTQMLENLGN